MDDVVAVIGQGGGEADIGGGVKQNVVTLGAENVQGAGDAAQNTVGIANVLALQTFHTVADIVPADDAVIVFLPGGEIAVGCVLRALDDGFGNGGAGGEIHIRDPHGNHIETIFGTCGAESGGLTHSVHRDGIHAPAVHNGGEIVFHLTALLLLFFWRYYKEF